MLVARIVMLGWSVMSAWGQDHGHGEADMATPAPGHTASPKGADVYFHDPIVGVDKIDLNQPIPSDYNPIHLGNG
jgi:hypothetical protein